MRSNERPNPDGDKIYLHYYTIPEVRALIPDARTWLRVLQTLATSIERVEDEVRKILPAMRANGLAARAATLEQELSGLYDEMGTQAQLLVERGIVLRDVHNGVVDFPSWHRGRLIMLCWQVDEDDLGYWHEADAGYLTRQPLDWLASEE